MLLVIFTNVEIFKIFVNAIDPHLTYQLGITKYATEFIFSPHKQTFFIVHIHSSEFNA